MTIAKVSAQPWDWSQNSLTVPRLGAFLREVAHLIAVAALNVSHVLRLGALFGDVAFLAAVAAAVASSLGAILREVAHLVALAALDIVG